MVGVALAAVPIVGCNGDDGNSDDAVGLDDVPSLEELFSEEGEDQRPLLLAELGTPDSFVISVDEAGGVPIRLESWRYHEADTEVELVDGEVVWTVALDPLPDETIYPLGYSPVEFTMLDEKADVFAELSDVDLELIDTGVTLEDVEGAEVWAGEQLALAFIDDLLVHVETYPLAPGEPVRQ